MRQQSRTPGYSFAALAWVLALLAPLAVIAASGRSAAPSSEATTRTDSAATVPALIATATAEIAPAPAPDARNGGQASPAATATDVPSPAPTRRPAFPSPTADAGPGLLTQARQLDDLLLTLAVSPGLAGYNEVSLYFQDATGGDGGVSRVLLRLTYLDATVRPLEVEATIGHPGHAFIIGEHLRHAGRWRIEATLQGAGRRDASAAFDLQIQ